MGSCCPSKNQIGPGNASSNTDQTLRHNKVKIKGKYYNDDNNDNNITHITIQDSLLNIYAKSSRVLTNEEHHIDVWSLYRIPKIRKYDI